MSAVTTGSKVVLDTKKPTLSLVKTESNNKGRTGGFSAAETGDKYRARAGDTITYTITASEDLTKATIKFGTKVWKGKKMAGRMGGKLCTMQGLMVWKVMPKLNLLYLVGSVPGTRGAMVRIRDTNHPKLGFSSAPPFPTYLPPADAGEEEEWELLSPAATEVPAAPTTGKRK